MEKTDRKKTREVSVGKVKIGGDNPVAVQSMTNMDTKDVEATVKQIKALEAAGCEIIRVAVPDLESSQVLGKIKERINIPLVADIHFSGKIAIESIKQGVDKLRINPGNFPKQDLKQIIELAQERGIPIRVGVNAGSLEKEVLEKHGGATAEAMVESALRSIQSMQDHGFDNLVLAIKASDIRRTIRAYELLSEKTDHPLHLGITEAGTKFSGTIKSSIGIGYLLIKGIGETLRISLSTDPVEEVRVAWEMLKALELREKGVQIISCPTCARASINVTELAPQVEEIFQDIKKPLKIAVMGCVVNGPGEAGEVDLGVIGAGKKAMIMRKGRENRFIDKNNLLEELKKEVDSILKD